MLALLASGCASLAHGTHQEVGIDSFPAGAHVFVNGELKGVTPAVIDLKRNVTQKIKIDMAGYQPYETVLHRTMSGWTIATAAICGIAGLAVDKLDGAIYNLTPGRIEARLAKLKLKPSAPAQAIAAAPPPPSNEIRRLGPPVSDGLEGRPSLQTRLDSFVDQLSPSSNAHP
jgi:hypothetical protein